MSGLVNVLIFHYLSDVSEAPENPYGEDDSKSPFPVQPPVKRSYAQNVTVWIKASGLQVPFNTFASHLVTLTNTVIVASVRARLFFRISTS